MKRELNDLKKKVDLMVDELEPFLTMKASEPSLKRFFTDEPVLYSEKDLKVKYR
ncbi:MAG: hypothetical protein HYU39_07035 [Thaumarchaeota archaeon]|nr:hypothetical protein [Nitrososphaerota archaeon]